MKKMAVEKVADKSDFQSIDMKSLKKSIMQRIKSEISEDVSEPTQMISIETGKLQTLRPENAIEKLENVRQSNASERGLQLSKSRISTGIQGLDEVMEGGFRQGSTILLGGGAGSGKSVLCMQFLVEGITEHDEAGIYLSFEEQEDKLIKNFEKFNWNIRGMIEKRKLAILYYSPEQVEKVLETGGGIVRDLIESMNAKRLVIDSLTAFTLLFESEMEKRKSVLKLIDTSSKWGVTTLVTSEHESDPDKHESNVLEFEVDGVILLYNLRRGDVRERSLEIFKMRGIKHATKIFPMRITEDGIIIYPDESVF